MEDITREILNEIEQDKVIALAQDPVAFNAIKKYILAVAYRHGIVKAGEDYKGNVNFALNLAWGATESQGMPRTDEELGQNLRAMTYATKLVESGFKELLELRKPEPVKESEVNVAE